MFQAFTGLGNFRLLKNIPTLSVIAVDAMTLRIYCQKFYIGSS